MVYSITFPSLTKRPDFLQSDAYFNHMYMSSWGETTSVWTWMIRCQSSTTRWQPCIQSYAYWYIIFNQQQVALQQKLRFLTKHHQSLPWTGLDTSPCLYYVFHLACLENFYTCITLNVRYLLTYRVNRRHCDHWRFNIEISVQVYIFCGPGTTSVLKSFAAK